MFGNGGNPPDAHVHEHPIILCMLCTCASVKVMESDTIKLLDKELRQAKDHRVQVV